MSIDAVAVLQISALGAVEDAMGGKFGVDQRGDAALLRTHVRYKTPPDELSAIVYQLLGARLDAHRDARGILFFPDVIEPAGQSYDALVREIGDGCIWGPIVEGNHVPLRYSQAAQGSREWHVAQLMEKLGRDKALEIDMMAGLFAMQMDPPLNMKSAKASFESQMTLARTALGDAFAANYAAALKRDVARELEAARTGQPGQRTMMDTIAAGQPLVSQEQMDAVMQDERIQDLLKKL